jgi:hypothetical protein
MRNLLLRDVELYHSHFGKGPFANRNKFDQWLQESHGIVPVRVKKGGVNIATRKGLAPRHGRDMKFLKPSTFTAPETRAATTVYMCGSMR